MVDSIRIWGYGKHEHAFPEKWAAGASNESMQLDSFGAFANKTFMIRAVFRLRVRRWSGLCWRSWRFWGGRLLKEAFFERHGNPGPHMEGVGGRGEVGEVHKAGVGELGPDEEGWYGRARTADVFAMSWYGALGPESKWGKYTTAEWEVYLLGLLDALRLQRLVKDQAR